MIERNNLEMINEDEERCEGKYTWQQRGSRSVIDFVICNINMNNELKWMKIDEEKIQLDISDHNLISIGVEIYNHGGRYEEKTKKVASGGAFFRRSRIGAFFRRLH